MCGRFDTSHLYWRDIHDQLANLVPVRTEPLNLEPNDDVRPTTRQVTARLEDGAFVLEKMRWGLVPFWRNGKPLKDTAKGADDGFKLTTFNCKVETCHSAATFRDETVAALRASLIKKGMIYAPSLHDVCFTVPLFDAFMRRALPNVPQLT